MTLEPASASFELRHAATDHLTIVTVPERRLFAVDGIGDTSSAAYRLARAALRTVAETLRQRLLRSRFVATRVGVLECQWWTRPEPGLGEMAAALAERGRWHWRQMIEVPHLASELDLATAMAEAAAASSRAAPLARLVRLREGRSAQLLQLGGEAAFPATVEALCTGLAQAGLGPRGELHQLHLTDPERVPADRCRSIVRIPVQVEGPGVLEDQRRVPPVS